ncbi:MAG: AsmA family protein [Proteobacteria bacterium]|nr:AsmA family protein [Pseudomonadota bacterium]
MKAIRTERKKGLIIAGGVVALIVIAAIAVVVLFDINSYKSKIETVASVTTGLDVRINGKMGLSFFPFGISAKDVHIAGKGGGILSLERLKLGAELMPLLRKQLKVTGCELDGAAVIIVKDAEGKYNFENTEKKSTKGGPGTAFSLNELKLSKGSLVYLDKKTGEKTEFKEINLVVKGLSITDTSGDVIKHISFTGNIDCKEMRKKDLKIENFKTSMKAVKGIYNFEPLAIRSLAYLDKKTGEKTELKEINLVIKDLSIVDTSGDIIKNVFFTGNIDCKEMRKKDLKIDSIRGGIRAEKGVFSLKPLTMDIFGAKGEGDVTANKSEADTEYKINVNVLKLDFEKLQESFGVKRLISGKGDLVASLTIKEKGGRSLIKGMDGILSIQGNNLITHTVDLDKVLSTFETSQKFNLVDIGAFFVAGPLGSAALKGYRYGDVYYQAQGGQGAITQFVSHWKIKSGEADARDCAFATRHNRIALKGKLNLVSERYDNVTVALLDDRGCAKFKQTISGPFGAPQVGVVSTVESLASPILNLYKQAKRFAQAGKCEVFYSGSVQQPR